MFRKTSWRHKRKDFIKKILFFQIFVIKNVHVDPRYPEPDPDSPESLEPDDMMDIDLNQRFPLGDKVGSKVVITLPRCHKEMLSILADQ